MRGAFAIIAATLTLAFPAYAAPPDAIKARYEVYKDGLRVAMAQESFEKRGGTYSIVSDSVPAELLALFVRTRIKLQSKGLVNTQGLRPEQFDYERLDDTSKNVNAKFDWRAMRLNMTFDGRQETAALSPGTQDRLSIMYHFMFVPPSKLKQISVPMTNGKKIERYDFTVNSSEALDTALGKLKTVHLVKQLNGDDKNAIEVWLASEHYFAPVKVVIVESDGSRYEQLIVQLDFK